MWADKVSSLIHLFEDGQINRRQLVEHLTKCTGSIAAALAAINAAGLADAQAPSTPITTNDPSIRSENLTISGEAGPLFVYQSMPMDSFSNPCQAVLVIHENAGLTDYIKDVTRRVAVAGYVGFAVDLLSRQGGTSAFPDGTSAMAAYNRTTQPERRADMLAALYTIRDQTYVRRDKLAAVGFCAGGGNIYDLVLNTDALTAAVAFYGAPVLSVDAVPQVNIPLLFNYAELDRALTGGLGPVIQAMSTQQKRFEAHVYSNANHAFHNDTSPRYEPAARWLRGQTL